MLCARALQKYTQVEHATAYREKLIITYNFCKIIIDYHHHRCVSMTQIRDDSGDSADQTPAATMWTILLPLLMDFEELLKGYAGELCLCFVCLINFYLFVISLQTVEPLSRLTLYHCTHAHGDAV